MALIDNLSSICQRIADACKRAGREPTAVTLLAVSKGMPPQMVGEAAAAGLTLFGENKVQEAKAKIPMCPGRLRWHMIGHLQSNKCRDAVHWFEMIHSVDSVPLAQEIQKWADREAKSMPILLEVNLAGDSNKFGFRPDAVLPALLQINSLPRVEVQGLMTLGPWTPDLERVRTIFRQLRELKSHCEQTLGAPLPHLSMGMSGDYEVAVEEGATIVRLGTALFGPRPKPARPVLPGGGE